MRASKATHLALTLFFAAGASVCAGASQAQTASSQKKPSYSKSPGSAAHKSKPSSSKSSRSSKKKTSRRERGQKAPTPDRVSEIQQALAKDGSYAGTPSGKWDDSTVEAMKKFQAGHGLNPSGRLDAKTLQQLGLGSSTAGVAPPMPSANSSSLKTSPSPPARPQR
jgi:peptidoglycan hydrolase-like protein with peptidoglycan-binding domain